MQAAWAVGLAGPMRSWHQISSQTSVPTAALAPFRKDLTALVATLLGANGIGGWGLHPESLWQSVVWGTLALARDHARDIAPLIARY